MNYQRSRSTQLKYQASKPPLRFQPTYGKRFPASKVRAP